MPTRRRLDCERADEKAIIARCLAGDRKAYGVLVERYKDLVHDMVYRMIGDAVRAEDIAQDAFVKAYLSLRDFRGESRFSTWLCRIAMNRCKDTLRRARREILMPGDRGSRDRLPARTGRAARTAAKAARAKSRRLNASPP